MPRIEMVDIVFDLDAKEVRERSVQLGEMPAKLTELEEAKKSDAKLWKDHIDAFREEMEKTGLAVIMKKETRRVKIEKRRVAGRVQIILVETGELLSERLPTKDEQQDLFSDSELGPMNDEQLDDLSKEVADKAAALRPPGTKLRMVVGGSPSDEEDDGEGRF